MATNAGTQTSDSSTDSTETAEQDNQDQGQQSTDETSGQDGTEDQSQDDTSTSDDDAAAGDKPAKDPAKQALLADLHKERTERKASQARVTELEAQVAELAPLKETLEAVQNRSTRLEEFISAAGGPLSKAMDSKSFTTALFESDKPIADIVKDWNQANPSATSTALGSAAAAPAGTKPNMNDLLRSAAK